MKEKLEIFELGMELEYKEEEDGIISSKTFKKRR